MFPMRARGAATGLATLVLNFGTLIVAQLFPVLNSALSTEWVFLIFAFIAFLLRKKINKAVITTFADKFFSTEDSLTPKEIVKNKSN